MVLIRIFQSYEYSVAQGLGQTHVSNWNGAKIGSQSQHHRSTKKGNTAPPVSRIIVIVVIRHDEPAERDALRQEH